MLIYKILSKEKDGNKNRSGKFLIALLYSSACAQLGDHIITGGNP